MDKSRTHLAYFFLVIDSYLDRPDVCQLVEPQALAFYEMERSADEVFRAMHLLEQGHATEAQELLKSALSWRNMLLARHRPRRLARLLVGIGLLASTWLGLGVVSGHLLYQSYHWNLRWRQRPVKRW